MTDSDYTLPSDPDRTHVADGSAGPGSSAGIPDRVGRYRPLRILGQGGMGVVYEAEQEEPRRRVALKVIRPELATEDLRRRFAHESVFLGRLQHPGIAQVYEAGTAETPDGPLPFIAMELVDGMPLDSWVRTQEPDRTTRIELMIRLCDAVQHAHQRGLIHRDLKPGNILVDGRGHPRVLDFGVARPADTDLETSLVTTHGELVGTLSYMSPEQLAGDANDIDTRSDVYALGVILYQLMADQSPLDLKGRSLEEVLRAIREDEPVSLATHDSRLAGDLTLIAATAMAKDRVQRYASANGLAMDLQRYLDDEPIAARPPSTVYQLRKFARRHRPLVVGAIGVAAALVLGVVGSTWQAVRATRAEQLAETRQEQAETVTNFLQDMLAAVSPAEAQGRDVTVSEVLDRAATDLDRGSLAAQPQVEMALRHTLGNTYMSLGKFDISVRQLTRGVALADSLLPIDAPDRLQLRVDQAEIESRRGRHDVAEGLLTSELPRIPPDGELAAEALTILADVRYTQGRWQAADSLQHIVQRITAAHDDADSLGVALVMLNRAFLAEERGDLELAGRLTERAATIYRDGYGPGDPRMIRVLNKQGDLARANGRYLDSLPYLEEALAIAEAIYPEHHPLRADVLWRLGQSYTGTADFDAALAAHEQALEIRRVALGPIHRDIALVLQSLGTVEARRGQFTAAEERMHEALTMRRDIFGTVHTAVIASMESLGHLARAQNQPARAESLYVAARDVIDQLPEAAGDQAALNSHNTAMARQEQGDHEGAEIYFRQALEIIREEHGETHARVARAMTNLVTNLFRQGRKSEAADLQAEALAMNRQLGLEGQGLMLAIGNAAFILDDAGRYDEAAPLHVEYIELAGEVYGTQEPRQSSQRTRYFKNLVARNLWDEAEEQARLIVAWRQEYLPEDDYKRVTGSVFLAEAMLGQGRLAEADSILTVAERAVAGGVDVPAKAWKHAERIRQELNANLAAR